MLLLLKLRLRYRQAVKLVQLHIRALVPRHIQLIVCVVLILSLIIRRVVTDLVKVDYAHECRSRLRHHRAHFELRVLCTDN